MPTDQEAGVRSPSERRYLPRSQPWPLSSRIVFLGPVLGPDHVRDVIGEARRRIEQPYQAGDRELVA